MVATERPRATSAPSDLEAAHADAECALAWLARCWDKLRDADPDAARRIVAATAVIEKVRAEIEPPRAVRRRPVRAS
jgi:hypothetical protein